MGAKSISTLKKNHLHLLRFWHFRGAKTFQIADFENIWFHQFHHPWPSNAKIAKSQLLLRPLGSFLIFEITYQHSLDIGILCTWCTPCPELCQIRIIHRIAIVFTLFTKMRLLQGQTHLGVISQGYFLWARSRFLREKRVVCTFCVFGILGAPKFSKQRVLKFFDFINFIILDREMQKTQKINFCVVHSEASWSSRINTALILVFSAHGAYLALSFVRCV